MFPIGTNDYMMHASIIGALSLIVYWYFKSFKLSFIHILALTVFIELDQFICNTGTCDIVDIIAGLDGCFIVFCLIYINKYYNKNFINNKLDLLKYLIFIVIISILFIILF